MTSVAEPGATLMPGPPLWRSRPLVALFSASTTARLANESARVAMVLLVLARTRSPALAGAVVAATTLPALVTGPLLGAWLDKTSHRRAAFAGNQALLLLSLTGMRSWVPNSIAAAAVTSGFIMVQVRPFATIAHLHSLPLTNWFIAAGAGALPGLGALLFRGSPTGRKTDIGKVG